jgi:hypothetical protein
VTTYPSFRDCLVQVQWSSRELGVISLRKRLFFRPYKFQLLQELKPNDRPHRRNFYAELPQEDNLFLDKIVSSDKATFHL